MKFKPYNIKLHSEMEFVAHMVLESMKLLDSYDIKLKYQFLHGFIAHTVLSALKDVPKEPCGKKELYEFTKNKLASAKLDIQKSIAVGFEEAMALYSGQNIEYWCQIKPIPEAKKVLN